MVKPSRAFLIRTLSSDGLKLRSIISTSSTSTTISTNSGNWTHQYCPGPRASEHPHVPTASPALTCHSCGSSTTLSTRQYAVRLLRFAARWPILPPARRYPAPYFLELGMPHVQHLGTSRVRASPAKQDNTTLHLHTVVVDFRLHTLRLPISDYQARGAGLSKGPSFFSATNIPMTRSCTKAWKFTNNQHDTPCATLPPTCCRLRISRARCRPPASQDDF